MIMSLHFKLRRSSSGMEMLETYYAALLPLS